MEKSDLTYRDYARLARLPLDELAAGCEAQAFHASGPGGQCVNTKDSAVRMTHRATGITVTSRESRSQYRNRQLCLQKIRAELERRPCRPRCATPRAPVAPPAPAAWTRRAVADRSSACAAALTRTSGAARADRRQARRPRRARPTRDRLRRPGGMACAAGGVSTYALPSGAQTLTPTTGHAPRRSRGS